MPHAGYGENAYYDRESKSLQFYYFDRGEERRASAFIPAFRPTSSITSSAMPCSTAFARTTTNPSLPRRRPSTSSSATSAAILIAFRNNEFRGQIAEATGGDLDEDNTLSSLAEEFGKNIGDQPYLRSALNQSKYEEVKNDQRQHYMSQVLTGAMFDIIRRLTAYYMKMREQVAEGGALVHDPAACNAWPCSRSTCCRPSM